MGIRDRLAGVLLSKEIREIKKFESVAQEAASVLEEAYRLGPRMFSPDDLVERISEFDSHYLDYLVSHLRYTELGTEIGEDDRLRVVREARILYRKSVLSNYVISLWTNYGFSDNVKITPNDDKAVEIWEEFWNADRNRAILSQRELHVQSNIVLRDGEFYNSFWTDKTTGLTTIRRMPTEEITNYVKDPNDSYTVVFYERTFTPVGKTAPVKWYYPDWNAFSDVVGTGFDFSEGSDEEEWRGIDQEGNAITGQDLLEQYTGVKNFVRADRVRPDVFVCMMPVQHNKMTERGWPLMSTGFDWDREHKRFRENRAAVAEGVATFIREVKGASGSRGIDALKNRFQSSLATGLDTERNPPAAPGSTLFTNEAVNVKSLSQRTDAGDAKTDGEALAWMTLLSGGVFPHYAGMGDAYRLATAKAMEGPLLRQWGRYQRFWASVWRDVTRLVLSMYTRYTGVKFSNYDSVVSMDKLVELDIETLSTSLSMFYNGVVMPLVEANAIPEETLNQVTIWSVRSVMHALGVGDYEHTITTDMFKSLPGTDATTPDTDKPSLEEAQAILEAASRIISGVA